MKTLLQHIQQVNPSPLGVVLYVGAGKGKLLPNLRRLEATKVVLCEPNPANVDLLQQAIDPLRHETLLPCALSPDAAPNASLHLLNNSRYSSTALPLRIFDLRANLKAESTLTVPAKPVAQIIEDLELSTARSNLLILNAQGSSATLLQAIPPDLLYRFEWLAINGMQIPDAYVGDRPITDISDFLTSGHGFELAMEDAEAIHPNAAVLFHRHPSILRILDLEAKITDLQQSLVDTSRIAQERYGQLQQLTQQRDARDNELATLKEHLQHAKKAQSELDKQLKNHQLQIENLTQTRDEQTQLAAERHHQLQQLTQQRDAQTTEIQEQEAQIEQLTQAQARADHLALDRQQQIQQLTQQRDARDNELATLKEHMQQAKRVQSELDKQLKDHQLQIENLTQTRDEQTRKADQQTHRIAQLEAERTELEARQHLFNEEMVRAEAQIDLIKDVLLREPGL